MANAVYPLFKQALLSPGVDLVNGLIGSGSVAAYPTAATLKAALLTGYTYSATDQYESAITSHIVGSAVAVTGESVTNGQLNASSVTFTSVASGSTVTSVVLFMDTGSASTSRLVAYIDTLSGSVAVNITTNGGNITVNWQATSPYIFSL